MIYIIVAIFCRPVFLPVTFNLFITTYVPGFGLKSFNHERHGSIKNTGYVANPDISDNFRLGRRFRRHLNENRSD